MPEKRPSCHLTSLWSFLLFLFSHAKSSIVLSLQSQLIISRSETSTVTYYLSYNSNISWILTLLTLKTTRSIGSFNFVSVSVIISSIQNKCHSRLFVYMVAICLTFIRFFTSSPSGPYVVNVLYCMPSTTSLGIIVTVIAVFLLGTNRPVMLTVSLIMASSFEPRQGLKLPTGISLRWSLE